MIWNRWLFLTATLGGLAIDEASHHQPFGLLTLAAQTPALEAPAKEIAFRTWLGIAVRELKLEDSRAHGLADNHGLLIDWVAPESPAEKAGLVEGDVLTQIDDQTLVLAEQLGILVKSRAAGTTIILTCLRDSKVKRIQVTLAQIIDERSAEVPRPMITPGAIEKDRSFQYKKRRTRIHHRHWQIIMENGTDGSPQLEMKDPTGRVIYQGEFDPASTNPQANVPPHVWAIFNEIMKLDSKGLWKLREHFEPVPLPHTVEEPSPVGLPKEQPMEMIEGLQQREPIPADPKPAEKPTRPKTQKAPSPLE